MPENLPRVLLVLTEFPPRIGGMQTHAIYLARHLHGRGYPVAVATYKPASRLEMATFESHDRSLGFPVHRVMSRLGHFHNLDLLERLASTFRPALIYCSTVFFGDLARRVRVPVVSRSVGNDIMRPWIVWPFQRFSRLVSADFFERHVYRWFRRFDYPAILERAFRKRRHALMVRSARQLAKVLANSQFTARELWAIEVPRDRVEVLPGGVDSKRFTPRTAETPTLRNKLGIADHRFVLLTVCRLEPKKGIDFLVHAMARVLERMPDAHLVIVGSGRRAGSLARSAAASPAANRITFAGRVAHEQVADYYRMADLFVLASREHVAKVGGGRDVETMGRVLCEANAAALPVVASRSGGGGGGLRASWSMA